jgi:hypothetical protein
LQTIRGQLKGLVEQRSFANTKLRELEAARDAAVSRVRAKLGELQLMANETQMINAQTDLMVSAKSMVDATSTSLDNLGNVGNRIAELNDAAKGRARITGGQANNMDLYDETQRNLEGAALQEFLSMTGQPQGAPIPVGDKRSLGGETIDVPSKRVA